MNAATVEKRLERLEARVEPDRWTIRWADEDDGTDVEDETIIRLRWLDEEH